MKRKFCFVFLIWMLIILVLPNNISAEQNETDDKLLSDALITLLAPYISKAIEDYYGYQKSYGLYDTIILDILREEAGQFNFKVKVQVNTFEEAHNPPYGKETIILDVNLDKVKVIEFIHKGDEWEKEITDFYDEAISDIRQTFKLNLNSYKELNYNQLMFKSETEKEYKSLSNIVTDIIDNELTPEINTPYTPYKNVINPVTFIKENQGYILFKESDGTNNVIQVNEFHNDPKPLLASTYS